MKQRLIDILVCPHDHMWPLKVHIFEQQKIENVKIPAKNELTNVVCQFYCSKKDIKLVNEQANGELQLQSEASDISYEMDCKVCLSNEISAGLLECYKCNTFYPIVNEIPMILKPELRNQEVERQFIEKWADKISEFIIKEKEL